MVSFDIFLKPNDVFESDSPFTRNVLYVEDLIKAIKTPSPSLIKANLFLFKTRTSIFVVHKMNGQGPKLTF